MEIRIRGKKGSKAVKDIVESTEVKRYLGRQWKGRTLRTDAIINYGLAGTRLRDFFRKFPSASNVPMINANIGHSKYTAVGRAKNAGILVPDSRLSLRHADNMSDWIEKLHYSIGGKGIQKAKHKGKLNSKYYQKMIQNRRFELRVIAFSWIPKEKWRVQKRMGDPDVIAWNFSQGGFFSTVSNPMGYKIFTDAMDISEKVLDVFGMSFGAVDFIVDTDKNIYFIEVNAAPGFTEISQPTYTNAFNALFDISLNQIRKLK